MNVISTDFFIRFFYPQQFRMRSLTLECVLLLEYDFLAGDECDRNRVSDPRQQGWPQVRRKDAR